MSKKLFSIFSLLMVFSMVLSACATEKIVTQVVKETQLVKETQVVETTKEVEKIVKETVEVVKEVTPTPVVVDRNGAWVDKVVFTNIDQAESAIAQLQAGDIDIYAYTVSDPNQFATVKGDPKLGYTTSFGSYNELTLNPSGPEFQDGRLNPFSNAKIREAMNMLLDRNYIAQEIFGGLAVPKFTSLNSAFADYARYVDVVRAIEAKYAYNLDKAKAAIDAEMTAMGATLGADGKWQYKDAPVTVIIIIRTEDKRKDIGDYVGNQLEQIGFTVDRQYKTRTEASPIWNSSDPTEGQWYIYTGGWITTAISRDDGTNFGYFYTNLGSGSPLWQAYVNTPEFTDIATKLWTNAFTSMEERGQMFKTALELAQQESQRVWLVDQISFSPANANLQVSYDLAGGVAGAAVWPYTIRFKGQEGGTVRWAQPGVLVEPWNPIAGSNWIYDQTPIRATQDWGTIADPYTGLTWPLRIESAAVVAKEGLPIAKTLDWVSLEFQPEIQVPADAWADWDAVNQKFITVGEKFTDTVPTALTKVTVTYPADLWTKIKWHDGSPLTMGDFVIGMILTFDRAKAESAIFDESAVPAFDAYMSHFKGVKIISTDPLVIETYDDFYALDAENMATSWWPIYGFGPGAWHNLALGIRAEADGLLAFSTDKAGIKAVEWTSFIAGPSLATLRTELDTSIADGWIPYAPTLGAYVTAEEAAARYANLSKWVKTYGHYWIGTGPFYLDRVYTVEKTLTLARNPDYPDLANRWSGFGVPKVATVELDGPGEVKIGEAATYDVFVTFADQPYPQAEIAGVKYLLFNAKGELVATGEATAVADGQYQVVLSADATAALEAGSNKLEVAVTSKVVSIPAFAAFEFVTTAP